MKNIDIYGARFQLMAILLEALRDLRKPRTKNEVIAHIKQNDWLIIEAEDRQPYKSTLGTEPRWMTLIAFARKDCVDYKFMTNDQRDSWESTKSGLNVPVKIREDFSTGELDVRKFFLWTPKLKARFDPSYGPSDLDSSRPIYMYRDSFSNLLKDPESWLRQALE